MLSERLKKKDMDSYDENTICQLRRLTREYLDGTLAFEDFYREFRATAHRLFDSDKSSMTSAVAREVEFYLQWEDFGPRKGHVPLNANWQYGSTEKFGWIDKEAFAERFAQEFSKLIIEELT